jgi:hypothetical protein
MIKNLEQLAKILDMPNEKQMQLSNLFLEFLKTKEAQDLINTTEETLLSKFREYFPEDLTIIKDSKDEFIVKFLYDDEEELITIKKDNDLFSVEIKISREEENSSMSYKCNYVNVSKDKLILILKSL